MEKYIKNGKYNACGSDFIYYENSTNCFRASLEKDKIEVYYGSREGGGEYFDIPTKAYNELMQVVTAWGSNNTRKLMKIVRSYVPEPEPNGLNVKMKLHDGNSFTLLADFKRAARKQGKDMVKVEEIIKEATSGNYSRLISTLASNVTH